MLYILTGIRTATHIALANVRAASEIAERLHGTNLDKAAIAEAAFNQMQQALQPDEQMLLDTYRRCTPEARANLIQTAALLSAGLTASDKVGIGNGQVSGTTGDGRKLFVNTGGGSITTAKAKAGRSFFGIAVNRVGNNKKG